MLYCYFHHYPPHRKTKSQRVNMSNRSSLLPHSYFTKRQRKHNQTYRTWQISIGLNQKSSSNSITDCLTSS